MKIKVVPEQKYCVSESDTKHSSDRHKNSG